MLIHQATVTMHAMTVQKIRKKKYFNNWIAQNGENYKLQGLQKWKENAKIVG